MEAHETSNSLRFDQDTIKSQVVLKIHKLCCCFLIFVTESLLCCPARVPWPSVWALHCQALTQYTKMTGFLVSFPAFELELPKDSNHVLFIFMSSWIVFGTQAMFNKFWINGTQCSLLFPTPTPPPTPTHTPIFFGCQKNEVNWEIYTV